MELIGSGVKRDPVNGIIDWDQYLKIIEISTKYGKKRSDELKKEFIYFRRLARSQKDDTRYEEIVNDMIICEQIAYEDKLNEITKKLGISDSDFQ